MLARFCYQTVTTESAEDGDMSDHGFYVPGMGKFSVNALENAREGTELIHEQGYRLREVIEQARQLGICENEGATWFYSHPEIEDYGTCEETEYSLHIDGVTPSTYARIARLIVKKERGK